MDPRVGSDRIGSRFCRILAGRVGSALRIFYFLLNIYWYHNRYESSNTTFGLLIFYDIIIKWLIQNYSIKDYTYGEGSGRGSGQSDFLSGIAGRVGSTFRRVVSGPRKVTRGQLCSSVIRTIDKKGQVQSHETLMYKVALGLQCCSVFIWDPPPKKHAKQEIISLAFLHADIFQNVTISIFWRSGVSRWRHLASYDVIDHHFDYTRFCVTYI